MIYQNYLLIDTSIDNLNQQNWVNNLLEELRKDPTVLEIGRLSVIIYGFKAEMIFSSSLVSKIDIAKINYNEKSLACLGSGLECMINDVNHYESQKTWIHFTIISNNQISDKNLYLKKVKELKSKSKIDGSHIFVDKKREYYNDLNLISQNIFDYSDYPKTNQYNYVEHEPGEDNFINTDNKKIVLN